MLADEATQAGVLPIDCFRDTLVFLRHRPLSSQRLVSVDDWERGNIVRKMLWSRIGLPRTQSAGKSSSMPCVRSKERNVGVASPERRTPFGRTLLRGTKERNTAPQLGG